MIKMAEEADSLTVIEGSRMLENCDDKAQDIALKGNCIQSCAIKH